MTEAEFARSAQLDETMALRRFIETAIVGAGRGVVTDAGYDFTDDRADVVFETPDGHRYEITIRRIDD